jgi:hypothetical protein
VDKVYNAKNIFWIALLYRKIERKTLFMHLGPRLNSLEKILKLNKNKARQSPGERWPFRLRQFLFVIRLTQFQPQVNASLFTLCPNDIFRL